MVSNQNTYYDDDKGRRNQQPRSAVETQLNQCRHQQNTEESYKCVYGQILIVTLREIHEKYGQKYGRCTYYWVEGIHLIYFIEIKWDSRIPLSKPSS